MGTCDNYGQGKRAGEEHRRRGEVERKGHRGAENEGIGGQGFENVNQDGKRI